ncbi:MAG: hypothetical protein ACTHJM_10615 [Marmoricola sp.]
MKKISMLRVLAVSAAAFAFAATSFQPSFAATAPYATATAQSANIQIGSSTAASSVATATNDGTGSVTPVVITQFVNYQMAQAGINGTSLACAGVTGSSTPAISSDGQSCAPSTSTSVGSVDFGQMPALKTALTSVGCSGLFLRMGGLTSYAYSDATNAPSGGANAVTFTVDPCGASGSTQCAQQPLTYSAAANHNLMTDIIAALRAAGTNGCSQIADALQGVVNDVTWLSNYQTTNPDGSFTVMAMHLASVTDPSPSHQDYAISTVGPNLAAPTDGTPMLSASALPIAGGLALVGIAAFVTYRRRSA